MKPTNHAANAHDYDPMHNEDVAHEHGDIDIRALMMFVVGLAAVVIVVWGLMYVLFQGLDRYAASHEPQRSPLALPGGQLPPEPRLLTNEPAQLRKVREQEHQALYGPADQSAGAPRMPIDEAKKAILSGGLPVRQDPAAANPRFGTRAAAYGESSSGRILGGVAAAPPAAAPPASAPASPAPEHKGH